MKRLMVLFLAVFFVPAILFADVNLRITVSGMNFNEPPIYEKHVSLPDDFATYNLSLGRFGDNGLTLNIATIDAITGRFQTIYWNLNTVSESGLILLGPSFSARLHKNSPVAVSWFGTKQGVADPAPQYYNASVTWEEQAPPR